MNLKTFTDKFSMITFLRHSFTKTTAAANDYFDGQLIVQKVSISHDYFMPVYFYIQKQLSVSHYFAIFLVL